jgi:hypothetical protein
VCEQVGNAKRGLRQGSEQVSGGGSLKSGYLADQITMAETLLGILMRTE